MGPHHATAPFFLAPGCKENMNHTAKAGGWRQSTHAFIVRPSTRLVLNLLLILDILVVLAMFVLELQ